VKRSEAEWRSIVSKFETSDLSRSEFCSREGVAASSLSKWRQQLGGEPATGIVREDFVELRGAAPPDGGLDPGELHLILPGGVQLRWRL
jgi:hypothetical protein